MKFTAHIEGADKVIGRLQVYEQRKIGAVRALITRYAGLIAADAAAGAPEDEGDLKDSIKADLTDIYKMIARVGVLKEAYYAAWVELGTEKMRAQPFLQPAYERHAPDFLRELKRVLKL